jgi:hypothetical protein
MDIILAAFSSAALSARTIIVITITGDDDPKTRRPPGLAPGGFFIRASLVPLRPELTRASDQNERTSSQRVRHAREAGTQSLPLA